MELTELQKLQAQNLKLRIDVHNLQSQVYQLQSALNDRNVLIAGSRLLEEKEQFKKSLELVENQVIDWNTLEVVELKADDKG